MDGETDNQRQPRMERNTQEQRRYDKEADKKLRSVLYLALGNEEKRIFGQKFTQVKTLQISFKEFWDSLAIAFVRKTNVTLNDINY